MPLICQPPRIVLAAPVVAHCLVLPKGAYTQLSWKMWGCCGPPKAVTMKYVAAFQRNSVQSE
jgi:hypothetical protein